jgi:cellulose synthase (UDP-forming)
VRQGAEHRRAPAPAERIADSRAAWWSEHERVVQVVSVLALLAGAVYLVWRTGWSGRGANGPLFVTLLAAEAFGWLNLAGYVFLAWSVPRSRRPTPGRAPAVDVFVCTYDEPVHVVEPTLVGCRSLTVPHTTYLLDDGRRPEMAALAARLGARYVSRPDNTHAKAGNVNHALTVTQGELILVLDADHVPLPDILEATLGYFDDERLALVQTPHDFSNRDSVQHTRAERHEQSLFYRVVAPGKDRHDAMFWCGSATVIRRAALDSVGGVLTDTVAEDFHTSIAMHARGWRTRYHDEILVQGRAPHDLAAFLLQRARWARGNLAVLRTRENPLLCAGLTWRQRASYTASLANYFSGLQRLTLLVVLVASLLAGALPMHASIGTLAALWVPWSVLAFVATLGLGRGTLGTLDSTRYGLTTMGIHLRGVVALAFRSSGAFAVTPKDGIDRGGLAVLRMLGLCTTAGCVLAFAWALRLLDVAGAVDLPPLPQLATGVLLVLGAWELVCIAVTLVPLVRRRQLRSRHRTRVTMRARIGGTTVRVDVLDITPEGLAFEVDGSPRPGDHLTLLSRLPDARARLCDVSLPVEVRSCVAGPTGRSRVGGRFTELDDPTRECLLEFCDVFLPSRRLDADARGGPDAEPVAAPARRVG